MLIGHYDQHDLPTNIDCFERCNSDPKCAAACFTTLSDESGEASTLCYSFKFGFRKKTVLDGSSAYIKPEVARETKQLSSLGDEFPTVKQNARYSTTYQHYDNFDALTPAQCFKQCKASRICSAASFSMNTETEQNCFIYTRRRGTASDTENPVSANKWILYRKELAEGNAV
jgi:hypothetical protein